MKKKKIRGFIKGRKLEKSILKVKRQFEIIGLALEKPKHYSVGYFADMYGVEDITIMRDLQDLRGAGINIHSVNNIGVEIKGHLDVDVIITMIPEYIGFSYANARRSKATELLAIDRGEKAVIIIAALQRAIDMNEDVRLIRFNVKKEMRVKPLNLYHNDSEWFLVCQENEIKRLIPVGRIKEIIRKETTVDKSGGTTMFQLDPDDIRYRIIPFPPIEEATPTYRAAVKKPSFNYSVKDDTLLIDDMLEELIEFKIKKMESTLAAPDLRDEPKNIKVDKKDLSSRVVDLQILYDVFFNNIKGTKGEVKEKLEKMRDEVLKLVKK